MDNGNIELTDGNKLNDGKGFAGKAIPRHKNALKSAPPNNPTYNIESEIQKMMTIDIKTTIKNSGFNNILKISKIEANGKKIIQTLSGTSLIFRSV